LLLHPDPHYNTPMGRKRRSQLAPQAPQNETPWYDLNMPISLMFSAPIHRELCHRATVHGMSLGGFLTYIMMLYFSQGYRLEKIEEPKQTSWRMPPGIYVKLDQEATRLGIPITTFIREASMFMIQMLENDGKYQEQIKRFIYAKKQEIDPLFKKADDKPIDPEDV
jgi:hypothetical protein